MRLKKILIFISIIFSICVLPLSVSAHENDNIKHSEICIDDNFSDDKVLVVLNKEASFRSKEYTKYDFEDIGCIKVEDLTSSATDSIINNLDNDLVNVDNYKRVLCIYLNKHSKENVINVIKELSKRNDVLYAEPDYKIHTMSSYPNDIYCNSQWAINNLNLNQAWDYSTGSFDTVVGLLDTGIDSNHPDLASQIKGDLCRNLLISSTDAIYNPTDYVGHGTHVAGIIGATGGNETGIAGVAWNVGLVSLQVQDAYGFGTSQTFADAIDYAIKKGIKILNYSGGWESNSYNNTLNAIIQNYNGLLVCAVGNDGKDIDDIDNVYPACFEANNILTVGSIDSQNNRSDFSNYGLQHVDIFAPGSDILSTYSTWICDSLNFTFYDGTKLCEMDPDIVEELQFFLDNNNLTWEDINYANSLNIGGNTFVPKEYKTHPHHNRGYHYMSGTSMAAPFVTGVAALILSENPNLSPIEIKNYILNGTTQITISTPKGNQTVKKLNAVPPVIAAHTVHLYKSWEYDNRISHIEKCACGHIGTKKAPHIIDEEDLLKPRARCLDCKALIDMSGNGDIGMVPGIYSLINNNIFITEYGSYVLPNGIIVLVGKDLELYLNGELHFG